MGVWGLMGGVVLAVVSYVLGAITQNASWLIPLTVALVAIAFFVGVLVLASKRRWVERERIVQTSIATETNAANPVTVVQEYPVGGKNTPEATATEATATQSLKDRLQIAADWCWNFYRMELPEKPRPSPVDDFGRGFSTHPTVPMKWTAERVSEFVKAGAGAIDDLRLECRRLGLNTAIPDPFNIETVQDIAKIANRLGKAAQETSS